MSLLGSVSRPGPSGYGYSSTAESVVEDVDVGNLRVLITGVNSGLGFETARVLASGGATVVGTARTEGKAHEACRRIGADCRPVVCELGEPDSVRACAERVRHEVDRLDAIVCNAGIMAPPERTLRHGYELQFMVNHVGHFLLTTELLGHLANASGRVVVVSSDVHNLAPRSGIDFDSLSGGGRYSGWRSYGQSKLANILFARELARRFERTGRTANAVHPGVVRTDNDRFMPRVVRTGLRLAEPLTLKTIPQAAATQTWATVHPDAGSCNGEYLVNCNVGRASSKAADAALARRLWERTEQIIAAT